MIRNIFSIILILGLIIAVNFSNISHAQSSQIAPTSIFSCSSSKPYCDWVDLANTISNLIRIVIVLAYWITFLIAVIGSFLIMIEGPSPGSYQRGKTMIIVSIGAYILILFSGVIFDFILNFFKPQLYNP